MLRSETGQALALELRDLLAVGEGVRHGLAGHLGELGLVVECFQVRRAAGLIEEDDALSLGRMMQRIDHAGGSQQAPVEQRIQGQQADAGKAVAQESAAADVRRFDADLRGIRWSYLIPGNRLVQIQNRPGYQRHGGHSGSLAAAVRGASPTLISSAADSGDVRKRSRFLRYRSFKICRSSASGLRFRARSKAQSSCRSNARPPCCTMFSANTRALRQRSDRSSGPGLATAYWS